MPYTIVPLPKKGHYMLKKGTKVLAKDTTMKMAHKQMAAIEISEMRKTPKKEKAETKMKYKKMK